MMSILSTTPISPVHPITNVVRRVTFPHWSDSWNERRSYTRKLRLVKGQILSIRGSYRLCNLWNTGEVEKLNWTRQKASTKKLQSMILVYLFLDSVLIQEVVAVMPSKMRNKICRKIERQAKTGRTRNCSYLLSMTNDEL
ncbi:uncharacterized protein LOC113293126 [Papaver somniferum]|uniref:uncharacterized protein LOC113293126 n=1 Tax=Papaver somniferum TaxID=3469 RepID=UPI000E70172E|nr:uncharacterized protein LOC113293126 [Papaver somniferum]